MVQQILDEDKALLVDALDKVDELRLILKNLSYCPSNEHLQKQCADFKEEIEFNIQIKNQGRSK